MVLSDDARSVQNAKLRRAKKPLNYSFRLKRIAVTSQY